MADALNEYFKDLFVRYSVTELIWIGIGFTGQAVFASRFVIQWVASERRKRSYIPVVFWYLSIVGSLILLAYSLYKKDIVFIAGNTLNSVIYIRNIYLIMHHKERKMGFKFGGVEQEKAPQESESPPESTV